MNGANINMNGYTLQVGNGSGATLSYVGGFAYGGTWKRWLPATAISDSSGGQYGLFPLGNSSDYRYIMLYSTVNPTTPCYISATHTDVAGVTLTNYTDNGGSLIEEIANMHSDLTTTSLAGGTYNIKLHYTGFSASGNVSDLKLETYTGGVMGSAGTHVTTVGPANTPTVVRTGLTLAQLSNAWVCGTNDKNASPLYAYYYSRKTGNWSDTSAWSLTSGGAGASCGCTPISGSYETIDSGQTITINRNDSAQIIDLLKVGTLIEGSSHSLAVSGNLTTYGTGVFTNNGTTVIQGALILASGTSSSSGSVTAGDAVVLGSGGTYKQTGGTLTLTDEIIDSGTITIGPSGAISINGVGTTISGTGAINDSAGTISISSNKTISSGSSLTFGTATANTTIAIASGTTLSNVGTVTVNGSITGAAASSTWINNAQSNLSITGTILSTGVLDASVSPNTVNYSGSGSQTIKDLVTSYYNLTASNAGAKSLSAAAQVTNALTISGSAILDEGTNILSGTASINMTGASQLKLQRSVADVYPELTGIYSLTGGTVIINQTADSAIISPAQYYNLTLNGTTAYDISGVTTISNNFYLQNSAFLDNNNALTIGGIFTDTSSATTSLSDNITVYGIALKAGTLDDDSNTITINGAGGWNRSGGTFKTYGQTIFAGSSAQNIGGSGATTFATLVINNPGNVTLNVSPAAATVVTTNFNLMNGNLITNSTNILRLLDTATVSNGSASSYVSGPHASAWSSANFFIFPIGNNGVYGQAGISGIIDSTTEVTAQYFNNTYSTLTPRNPSLTQVSHTEYWNISRAVTSDSLQLQLFWTNATNSDMINCSYLTVAYYNGSQWMNEPGAAVNGSVCTGTGSGSAQTNGYVNSFGPFTFGGSGGDALPIELLSFTATPAENNVLTNWSTAVEINNDYFTVERSSDAVNFTEEARVEGAGNSTTQKDYEWTDKTPLMGTSYYRLKQTDFNGNSTYSDIVAVNLETVRGIELFPNPAHNNVFLTISNPTGEIQCKIYDIDGKMILTRTLETEDGNSTASLAIPIGNIPAGMYLVYLSDLTGNIYRQKLIIK